MGELLYLEDTICLFLSPRRLFLLHLLCVYESVYFFPLYAPPKARLNGSVFSYLFPLLHVHYLAVCLPVLPFYLSLGKFVLSILLT